ncbi:hypothetical protein DFO67_108171 [Modicisalibacter xianhensis]|uniref:Uncharacterized protein n=1 Tax=Modicisalibacter xianhensis TaxID=442341 RepID=A0A4R8FUE0_9GAMM|nr:hypothetical protein DFO67_108171 [Halomonas xianhensis]
MNPLSNIGRLGLLVAGNAAILAEFYAIWLIAGGA